jgi:hypothetical protein
MTGGDGSGFRQAEQGADQGPGKAAEGVGADGHADQKLSEDAGQPQPAAEPEPAQAGQDDQNAQLENETDDRIDVGAGRHGRAPCGR